ncbi:putative transferase, mitochondrial [Lachnellula hyalina]|uniref:Iron-sulfur cluster assembly factor IBA57 homolog, mitochondrial n=1 Tax=Lachnellula hyalina TaxID=1316788 RepID=A0A8H8QXY4_9HELO|nr:putative transferase, mitochondrial [Lachnellula hyalina]TVY24803.1 putative transferase, mitochondrial [Lachnellula hyalina]
MKPPNFPRLSPYICTTCRRNTPSFTRNLTTTATTNNPTPPPPTAFARLPSRRLISLTGPDSTRFLQGAITANIAPTPSSTSTSHISGFYTAFLNSAGRVMYDVFVYPFAEPGAEDGGWLIEVDAREVEGLAKHVRRYKLRSKFTVRVLEEGERGVWGAWDEDKRAPGMGRRLILPGDQRPEVDGEEVGEDVYRVRRYLRGVPEGQGELVYTSALPQESNVDYMGGVDYRKGCYVGQELTIRTHHRGVVRKRILPVMLYGIDEPMPTSLVYDPEKEYGVGRIPRDTGIAPWQKRGRHAGKFLSGVGNVGLGLCRLAMMTDVRVGGEAGGYEEGDEFKMEWQVEGLDPEKLKVKAFVPSWHLRE